MAKKTKNSVRYQIFANKKNKLIFFVFAFLVVLIPLTVFAQSSSTVRTRVGNAPDDVEIIKVALDLKAAYDSCNAGYTYENATGNLGSCLRSHLEGLGYDAATLDRFEQRRQSTMGSWNDAVHQYCTQCLGYIGLVFALSTNEAWALLYPRAADVARLSSFTVEGQTWQRIPSGSSPAVGDIGAHADSENGHIFIVGRVDGINVFAIEANGNSDCRVTDNLQKINRNFVYFRRV